MTRSRSSTARVAAMSISGSDRGGLGESVDHVCAVDGVNDLVGMEVPVGQVVRSGNVQRPEWSCSAKTRLAAERER